MDAGSRTSGPANNWFVSYIMQHPQPTWAEFKLAFTTDWVDKDADEKIKQYLMDKVSLDHKVHSLQDAVRKYRDEFKEKLRELSDAINDEAMRERYLRHLPDKLQNLVKQYSKMPHHTINLEAYMTLSVELAPQYQDDWQPTRSRPSFNQRAATSSGKRAHNDDLSSSESSDKRPRRQRGSTFALVKRYCREKKLCFNCKRPDHGASFENKCRSERQLISEEDLTAYELKEQGQ
jgi:hypothetical protein